MSLIFLKIFQIFPKFLVFVCNFSKFSMSFFSKNCLKFVQNF